MIKNKINFKKGAGTFLEFSITGVMLTWILLMIVGLFMKRYSIEDFELYSEQISREVVVCESLEDARQLAEDRKQELFSQISTIDENSVTISVDYAPGSPQEWKKGNFLVIYVTGHINSTLMITETNYSTRIMVMIENNG